MHVGIKTKDVTSAASVEMPRKMVVLEYVDTEPTGSSAAAAPCARCSATKAHTPPPCSINREKLTYAHARRFTGVSAHGW